MQSQLRHFFSATIIARSLDWTCFAAGPPLGTDDWSAKRVQPCRPIKTPTQQLSGAQPGDPKFSPRNSMAQCLAQSRTKLKALRLRRVDVIARGDVSF